MAPMWGRDLRGRGRDYTPSEREEKNWCECSREEKKDHTFGTNHSDADTRRGLKGKRLRLHAIWKGEKELMWVQLWREKKIISRTTAMVPMKGRDWRSIDRYNMPSDREEKNWCECSGQRITADDSKTSYLGEGTGGGERRWYIYFFIYIPNISPSCLFIFLIWIPKSRRRLRHSGVNVGKELRS